MTDNPMPAFVAVDWGTSSFRLWALSADGGVVADRRSAEGMNTVGRGRFEPVLRSHLAALGLVGTGGDRPVPVVLCGMVGARQGWREVPYVDIPARLDAVIDQATTVAAEGIEARILPGLARRDRDRPDVMRGEETQLLGLLLDEPGLSGLVCMPGTHAKWVRVEDGRVHDFTTSMTGELFGLLARHSILRHTIGPDDPVVDPATEAFRSGLRRGLDEPARMGQALFALRARGLLFGSDGGGGGGGDAANALSGLLIGAEVAGMIDGTQHDRPVILVASGRLAELYAVAVRAAGRTPRQVDADHAVRSGLLYAARRFWPELETGMTT